MRAPFVSLFCFPCAGASAAMYAHWKNLLPNWIKVIPVELPGRGVRFTDECIADYRKLIAQLYMERKENFNGHIAFFGHSMGALIAYGLTRFMNNIGTTVPKVIFASASPAPSKRNSGSPRNYDDQSLIKDLRQFGGTPNEIFDNKELMDIAVGLLRNDYHVCESFSHEPGMPLFTAIHVFGAEGDSIKADNLMAWGRETNANFSLTWFQGGHFFIRDHEQLLLQSIVQKLLSEFYITSQRKLSHLKLAAA